MRRCETSTTLKNLTLKNTLLKQKKCYNKRLTFTISNDNNNNHLRMKYLSSNSIKTDGGGSGSNTNTNTNNTNNHNNTHNHHKHRVTFLDNLITTTANSSNCNNNNNNTQPSSPKQLLSPKNLFNKRICFTRTASLNINNNNTTYSLTSHDNITTPRNTSSNILPNTPTLHVKSSKRLSTISKNEINFKERSEIRKVAGTYISSVSSYGSLFEINPESLMQSKQHNNTLSSSLPSSQKRNSNSKLNSLMKKTLYDILPSKLKYNYETSSTFRDLLSNTQQALHYQKKDSRRFLKSTTILIKKVKKHNKVLQQLLKQRNKDPSSQNKEMKHFLKLQSIRWLWQHKKLLIEKLFLYYHNYKWFFDKNEYLDKKKFKEFLLITNIGKDDEFAEHLFTTFEKQNIKAHTEMIYFKECLYSLILTANYTFERKVQLMLSIIENTSLKKINVQKYTQLLWMVLTNVKEWNYINMLIKQNGIDYTHGEVFAEKQVVYKVLSSSNVVKNIFEGYYQKYMQLQEGLSEQLANKFNFTVPNTLNLVYKKNEVRVINNMEVKRLERILDVRKRKNESVEQMQKTIMKEMEGKEDENESDNTSMDNEGNDG